MRKYNKFIRKTKYKSKKKFTSKKRIFSKFKRKIFNKKVKRIIDK